MKQAVVNEQPFTSVVRWI